MNWVCSGYFLPTGTCTCSMHFQLVKNKSLLKFNLQHNFRVPTCLYPWLTAYLPTCLPSYLPTCLPAYLSLTDCLTAYLPTCLPAFLRLTDCLPACLPAYLPTSLSQFDWLTACLPTCLSTYLPIFLPTICLITNFMCIPRDISPNNYVVIGHEV